MEYSTDPDHLLTPINGEGRQERALAERFFPTNFSHFDAARSTKFGLYGYVMITSKGRMRLLHKHCVRHILDYLHTVFSVRKVGLEH